ncbi:serine-rich adhesin for platelets [Eupeodes corollae]|uniref:serine-rich adhesin for platelets n=1 Tax=Eupeodes corollae TaxID=290404 RepID=UPI002490B709|nr:serine-rich adhesin for platelets [Eupeodes corollae]XP_055906012.1 serine-rich adhesin for platelets [Eupeodes corollae]
MSIVHPKSQWQWLLLLLLSFVLVQAFETPRETQCEHDSIPDLIKSSPVILKALGARIFTDYESYPFQDDIEITEELILKAQQQRDVPSSSSSSASSSSSMTAASVLAAAAASRRSTSASERIDDGGGGRSSNWRANSGGNHLDDDNEDDDVSLSEDSVLTGTTFDGSQWATVGGGNSELTSTLITLTPVTIYKGASALKITQQPDGMSGAGKSSYQYEEQLNATLEPLACFDSNILKLLPTEIIAFGKLVSDQRPDVLRISINGLHRWSPQFENRIWKYLGWDDWSDFTLCSVQCGKGVQQRFRRCLLDNPMININMNSNMNGNEMQQRQQQEDMLDVSRKSNSSSSSRSSNSSPTSDVSNQQKQHHNHHHRQLLFLHSRGSSNSISGSSVSSSRSGISSSSGSNSNGRSRNHSTGSDKDTTSSSYITNGIKSTITGRRGIASGDAVGSGVAGGATATAAATDSISLNKLKKRRKRKKAKSLSTMSCEGYNIEQRNCNTFECTDDISDLLKFYKKFLPLEELPTTLVPQQSESSMVQQQQQQQQMPTVSELASVGVGATLPSSSSSSSLSFSLSAGSSVPAAASSSSSSAASTASTTLLPNTGYIRSWKNSLNFTLMITLRLKNDTKSTSTVFSIRNSSHNLYVETSVDGLRLFQERDNTTEMLPVKFQLYDNRWHQVSISFQNGDFISIYVDCTWTNSFVVSKRLFSLPNDADVEIGRGFSGELQQLLVLPDNQERHQCSNVRTSINEVKRYIIDTFIDDYGN